MLRLGAATAIVWCTLLFGPFGALWASIGSAALLAPLNAWAAKRLGWTGDPDRLCRSIRARSACLAQIAATADDHAAPAELRVLAARAKAAGQALATLSSIAESLAQRSNPLWAHGVGALLLADWRTLRRAHAWRRQHATSYGDWERTLADAELASCLATWAAEQGGCWAEVADDATVIDAVDLAHPLLPTDKRIGNSVRIVRGEVLLITGANASGKSTFLRTCALAGILARLGTTVPAQRCRIARMRLATVMRVGDDLGAGRSRFQAEVAALAKVFTRLDDTGAPLLIVLDEILGGTNSRERHLGTEAVIRALAKRPTQVAAALISTHDLALCALANDAATPMRLGHFADRADDATRDLVFDYRLREGPAVSTNALAVMRAAGLPVD
jgi:hypothetical protein